MLRVPDGTDLVIGGGRRIGKRCIIPVVRTFTVCRGGGAAVSLAPVALVFFEDGCEYIALLPGAPRGAGEIIRGLRDDIEREKERMRG
ncbi:MAG: hypothetical protein GX880_06690 [Methanomicrobiales archaeon]|nr:hypothetical protein [Methanomicrobiales archaeon]